MQTSGSCLSVVCPGLASPARSKARPDQTWPFQGHFVSVLFSCRPFRPLGSSAWRLSRKKGTKGNQSSENVKKKKKRAAAEKEKSKTKRIAQVCSIAPSRVRSTTTHNMRSRAGLVDRARVSYKRNTPLPPEVHEE